MTETKAQSPSTYFKMKATALQILALFLFAITAPAVCRADVVWLEKEYDFGLMKEQLGSKTGSVRFVNTGPEEIIITGARPSCGCTSVDYPVDPIAVGDTATISFTYNPAGRPGRFEKSIRVYIGEYDTSTIHIRGNVLGTPESLSVLYPIEAGPLRLTESVIPAGEITYGQTRHFFVNGYNQTLDTIHPSATSADKALSIDMSSTAVGPGDIVTFSLYLNTRDVPEPGPLSIPVTIVSDVTKAGGESLTLTLKANIKPDFRGMSVEDEKKAPRCYILPQNVDLGVISGSKKRDFSFVISNQGETQMRVARVHSPSEAVSIRRIPSTVKAGKEEKATCFLDPALLEKGPFKIKIDIYTDDPLHPVRTLPVCGIIE